jgi:hypothetical protein
MKAYVGIEVYAYLTSALDEGEWSASCIGHFIPEQRENQYPLNESQGGQKSQSVRYGEERNFDSAWNRNSNLRCLGHRIVIIITVSHRLSSQMFLG